MADSSIRHLNSLLGFKKRYNRVIKKIDDEKKQNESDIKKYCECNSEVLEKMKKHENTTQKIGFTLTFSSDYHHKDPDDLYLLFIKFVKDNFEDDPDYIISVEFTAKGVMHFHGVIYNCYQRYINKILKKWSNVYGFVKYEYNISPQWEKYIIKDMDSVGYPVSTNI